jgi:hypothetical protein
MEENSQGYLKEINLNPHAILITAIIDIIVRLEAVI